MICDFRTNVALPSPAALPNRSPFPTLPQRLTHKTHFMKHTILLFLLAWLTAAPGALSAQPVPDTLTYTILTHDSLFWATYNACDVDQMRPFFSYVFEFYHDKGGVTVGLEPFLTSVRENLCGNADFRLRRAAVPGTVRVFPLACSGVIYGAIISGDHVFFIHEKGKDEYLDGLAKFTHVWLLQDDETWKMARILSYDHGPAPADIDLRQPIHLSKEILDRYVGRYEGPQTGLITFVQDDGTLVLSLGDQYMVLYPESERVFFAQDRNLTFEFVPGDDGKTAKVMVREDGAVVEVAVWRE